MMSYPGGMAVQNKQEIILKKGFNCRDLGGYLTLEHTKVKSRALIRAGYLSDLDAEDQAVLYNYGVRTIIDLRSPQEIESYPDQFDSRTHYLKIPILKQDLTESTISVRNLKDRLTNKKAGVHQMIQTYDQLIDSAEAQSAYHRFFLTLLELPTGGILFHCSTGKDRTGIITIFILKILKVPSEIIKSDYLLSNSLSSLRVNSRINEAKLVKNNRAYLQAIFDLSTVRETYFNQVISVITNKYGGFSAYFHNQLGLSESLMMKIREKFLV